MKNTKGTKVPQVGSRTFPTMASAAGAMSIPFPILRRLKGAGCPGFLPGGRVDEARVLQFAADHPDLLADAGLPALYDPLKAAQLAKLRFDLSVKRGQFVKLEDVKGKWAKGMEIVMQAMQEVMTTPDYNACIRKIKANASKLDL